MTRSLSRILVTIAVATVGCGDSVKEKSVGEWTGSRNLSMNYSGGSIVAASVARLVVGSAEGGYTVTFDGCTLTASKASASNEFILPTAECTLTFEPGSLPEHLPESISVTLQGMALLDARLTLTLSGTFADDPLGSISISMIADRVN